MQVFNLFTGATEPVDDVPAGFHQRGVALGERLGSSMLGMSVYDLEPGEKTWPYHFELAEEEWLLVVAGTPTLREPGGEQTLRPGDVVAFPVGPEGAHQVRNDSAEPVRVAILGTNVDGPDATVYPDTGKVKVRGRDTYYRLYGGPVVDYWEGET